MFSLNYSAVDVLKLFQLVEGQHIWQTRT